MAVIVDRLVADLIFRADLSGLHAFQAGLRSVRRRLNTMAIQSGQTGLIIGAMGGFAAYTFAGFQTELAKTEGLVGINRDQVQAYAEDIKKLAPAIGVGPRKLAEALFFATSAGLRGVAVNEALERSAVASRVGLGDQAHVVDLVTSAMNAYAHQGLSATQVTDSLTEAVRLGKLEPASLAIAMGQVLPITSALKVEFSEVSALMAAMSRTGTEASKASIQLGQVMNTLLKPTKDAEEGLEEVGLSAQELRDMAGSGHGGLFRTLQMLQTAFDGNNQALVKVFPNIRALRGVFDLLGPSMETNAWIIDEMADSTGVLDEAFKAVSNTLSQKWNEAFAQAQVLLIDMGKRVSPYIIQGLALARQFMDVWSATPERTKDNVAQLFLLAPALLATAVALKALATAMLPLIWAVGLFAAGLGLAQSIFESKFVRGLWRGVHRARLFLQGLTRTIAVGLVLAIRSLPAVAVASFAAVRAAVLATMLFMHHQFFLMRMRWIVAIGFMRVSGLTFFTQMRFASLTFGLSWARMVVFMRLGFLGAIVAMRVAFVGAMRAIIAAIAPIAIAALGAIGTILLIAAVAAVLILLWKPVSTFFRGFWTGLQRGAGRVGEAFGKLGVAGQKFLDALGPLGAEIRNLIEWLGTAFGDQTEAGENFGETVINAIIGIINIIIELLGWLGKVAAFFSGTFDAFGSWINQTFQGGKKFEGAFAESLEGADDYLPHSDARKGPFSKLTNAGRAIYDTLAAGVRQSPTLGDVLAAGGFPSPTPAPLAAVNAFRGGGGGNIYVSIGSIVSRAEDSLEVAREVAKEVANEVIDERNRKTTEEFGSNVGAS